MIVDLSQSFPLLERVPSLLQKLKLKPISIQIDLESSLEFNVSNMYFSYLFLLKWLKIDVIPIVSTPHLSNILS